MKERPILDANHPQDNCHHKRLQSAIAEHPLIFSTEMVRAILTGEKTQTRRIIKPQPEQVRQDILAKGGLSDNHGKVIKIKYQPGDRLWVRETYTLTGENKNIPFYKTYALNELIGTKYTDLKWKPSIFMPRKYARIWLEVVNVRVERVQEMNHQDTIDEGVSATELGAVMHEERIRHTQENVIKYSRIIFAKLWDSMNARRGFGWHKNPWVWVIEFKKIQR